MPSNQQWVSERGHPAAFWEGASSYLAYIDQSPACLDLKKKNQLLFKISMQGSPCGPVVQTRCFPCWDLGSIPGWGTKIPQAAWQGQKQNKKQHKVDFVRVCAQLYEYYHMYTFESLIAIRIRNSPINPPELSRATPCGHALPHP